MKGEDWLDCPEIPFQSPDEKEEWCKFKCTKCGAIDDVPGFVVDEFAMGLKKGEKVGIVCPKCEGVMRYKSSYYE